jgi:hypothetical protein
MRSSYGKIDAVECAREPHADELRIQHLPREARHHVHRIRATDPAGEHAEPAGVGRVRVRADHHAARERVLLEHDLVDDPRARSPEADAVARRHALQEVVDLAVRGARRLHVGARADVSLDQVVAVHGRGHRRLVLAREHELQERHLRRRVLHGDPVRMQAHVAATGLELLVLRVHEMTEEDLLRVGQGTIEAPAGDLGATDELVVGARDQRRRRLDDGHGDTSGRGEPT